jgi:sterol desaturase/sphingolipid hydroxylase (fatty acid hydroxylase superfamily)
LATLLLGAGAWLWGFDFTAGYKLVTHWAIQTDQWVKAHVPTVVELPYILAFLIAYGLAGFIHYWMHRISHERRLFWLLFHRFHHMPTVMFPASTPPVFFSVPLFIVVVIPYHLGFGMLTKLFCNEPLYFALIIYKLLFYMPDMWAHNTAMYHGGRNNPLVRGASLFFSNGIYHYLHHSSEVIDGKPTNTINLGGSFFYLPDKLFGTFKPLPEQAPPIGLTGNPPLHYNPFRLALSGMAQIFYELWHNRSPLQWWRILTGKVDYAPPVTADFALKPVFDPLEL